MYEKQNFKTGDVLTAAALNHIEEGIEKAMESGGGVTLITWAELKALRDANGLKSGTFYRITDYVTTTTQENTQSAGHPFDVIVLALSENKLSEEAYAALHDGDTYFAKSNLSAWKLWYCLDNDTKRFAWADAENGKGVIYRMIDEWNNDVPYDFKNIKFPRKITDGQLDEENGTLTYCYTFNDYFIDVSRLGDASLLTLKEEIDDDTIRCYDNVILPLKPFSSRKSSLNDIVFLNYREIEEYYECSCNKIGSDCEKVTFGKNAVSIDVGHRALNVVFGTSCSSLVCEAGLYGIKLDSITKKYIGDRKGKLIIKDIFD